MDEVTGLSAEEVELDRQLEALYAQNEGFRSQIDEIKDKRRLLTVRIDDLLREREAARIRAGRPTTKLG